MRREGKGRGEERRGEERRGAWPLTRKTFLFLTTLLRRFKVIEFQIAV